jgi:diadenylate cyclase
MMHLFSSVSWRDALDVLVVAFVAYRILVGFRGTRALQMLLGVGILVLASLVARRLNLQGTQWLLDTISAFWVVVLAVLFQPELRRSLERLAPDRLLQVIAVGGRAARAHVVDEIVGAAAALVSRRIGGLIVVERSAGLRQYAELGVSLDARVSADLLVSLFVPASPLHDGAVLVEGDRINAAGCFLPLSRSFHVGRALGTRHRAALGVAEETDAVAVVVSEETGNISVAVDSRIERISDPEALGSRLDELLRGSPPAASSRLPESLRRLLARPSDPA